MSEIKTVNLYETFILNALEPVLFSNADGQVIMWNKGCEHSFGYTEEEVQKYSLFSLVERKSSDSFFSIFEILKKGRTLSFETQMQTKTGEIIDMEITGGPIEGDGSAPPIIYLMFRDISRNRKLQSYIRKLSMYPENNPDFVLEWDRFTGITYSNQAVKDFFKGNDLDLSDLDKILPLNFQNYMRRLVGTDKKLDGVEAKYNDHLFSYAFTPFKMDDNKVLVIGKDVTAKKALEEEIDSAFDRTRHILDLIESILKEFRFIDLDEDIDITSVANQAIRDIADQTTMHPTHVFVGMENDERLIEGYVLSRRHNEQKVISDPIVMSHRELQKIISDRGIPRFENWYDNHFDISSFQTQFPFFITQQVPEIRNYTSYRIAGEKQGVLIAFNYPKDVNSYDGETIKGLSVAVGTLFSIQSQFKEKEEAQFAIITKMAELAEKRDQETGDHLKRMRNYTMIIAEELAKRPEYKGIIDREFIRRLYNSAPLHDIGKVGIPDAILQKPGKLDDKEYEVMREHTIIGGKVLEGPKFLEMARLVAYYHHEKYDGSGYPYGIKGEEIPLCARIVAIADVYDAMTSKRVYKEALSHDRTKKLLSICSGGHFAPDVVEAFLKREQDFLKIKETFKG